MTDTFDTFVCPNCGDLADTDAHPPERCVPQDQTLELFALDRVVVPVVPGSRIYFLSRHGEMRMSTVLSAFFEIPRCDPALVLTDRAPTVRDLAEHASRYVDATVRRMVRWLPSGELPEGVGYLLTTR